MDQTIDRTLDKAMDLPMDVAGKAMAEKNRKVHDCGGPIGLSKVWSILNLNSEVEEDSGIRIGTRRKDRPTQGTSMYKMAPSFILLASGLLLHSPAVAKEAPSVSAAAGTDVAYSVSPAPWEVSLGHHRAVVSVKLAAPAVRIRLPWRLPLADMSGHAIIICGPDGKLVNNVVRMSVSREAADIVFQAVSAGDYQVYYLPYQPQWSWGGCNTSYTPFRETADDAWRRQALPGGEWQNLPEAELLGFQARSEFDRFDPMEIIATEHEMKNLLAAHPDQTLLLFPEDRRYPIRMRNDLPLRWIKSGPNSEFTGEARPNEYYAFQIGAFAVKTANNLKVEIAPLRPESREGRPVAVTCFNTGGVDTWGRPFTKTMALPAGKVQALWFGADVARDQKPGSYTGEAVISADGIAPQKVKLKLTVAGQTLEDRGDGDLWRMARLRWLNSTAGEEETVTKPFTPLKINEDTVSCLGRTVRLGPCGFPASVVAGTQEVLSAPSRFVVETQSGPLAFQPRRMSFTKKGEARVTWEAESAADGVSLSCRGEMEYDGHLHYSVTLRTTAETDLKDVRLELPYRPESAEYFAGIGNWGGFRPKSYDWKWSGPYDSFWIGGVHAGLWCELRGGSYNGPMLNLYHPAPPATWGNDGRGGVSVRENGGTVLASAFSGARKLKAGGEITFEFALLVTPVRPLDMSKQFGTRFWHICPPETDRREKEPITSADPTLDALDAGINTVNLHQATPRNPYINYPFLSNDLIVPFTASMHKRGVKVKLYYTLRELSNYVAELWPLRSLGNEVIADGGGGGFAWLQEHLQTGYRPAWYSPFPDGSADAAFVNSGESRWYNYYVEGLGWMVKNLGIDGLYLDDVSYDRRVIQRMRRVMEREKPGCLIDLHSNTNFSIGPANQYLEFFPYIDRTWFGESFNYEAMSPDQWLVQTACIPFGMTGEMLQGGGNRWKGILYGMTSRYRWEASGMKSDPRNVWKIWGRFGIAEAEMSGYWEKDCPVRTGNPLIPATVYRRADSALIALASWAPKTEDVRLAIDWQAIGLDPRKARLFAPCAEGFQDFRQWAPDDPVSVEPGKGWMILVDEKGPTWADKNDPSVNSWVRQQIPIASWTPAQTPADWESVEWNIPAARLAGFKGILFKYTSGKNRLDIRRVELLDAGATLAADGHDGFTGTPDNNNVYRLALPPQTPLRGTFVLRAEIRGGSGTDSCGDVFILSDKNQASERISK